MRIHLISDLFLGYNEKTTEADETIPDVDLVILNGNLGHSKRSMLYAETLCSKYPDIPFVYNLGESEKMTSFGKYLNEFEENLIIKRDNSPSWPKNLYYDFYKPIHLTLKTGQEVDILCVYGYPKIHNLNIPWQDTIWFKEYCMGYSDNMSLIPEKASEVYHENMILWATMEWINEQHNKEWFIVKKWEIIPSPKKILVTHVNPYKDSRCSGQVTSAFDIHLYNGLWLASNQRINNLRFVGSKLVSNPGRSAEARNHVITID